MKLVKANKYVLPKRSEKTNRDLHLLKELVEFQKDIEWISITFEQSKTV